MAITAAQKEWHRYQPSIMGNRDPDEENPLILKIRFLTHTGHRSYGEKAKLDRSGSRLAKGEINRISRAKFMKNVEIESGFIYNGEPSTDVQKLWDFMPSQDLANEIDRAMQEYDFLIEGDPDKIKEGFVQED